MFRTKKGELVPIFHIGNPRQRAGKWYLDLKLANGKRSCKEFTTQEACIGWKETHRPGIPMAPDADGCLPDEKKFNIRELPEYDGTLRWFLDALAKCTREVFLYGQADRRNDLKAIASAGISAKHLMDQSKLEEEVKELAAKADEITRARKFGVKMAS